MLQGGNPATDFSKDKLDGGTGLDKLYGGGGPDELYGGQQYDELYGYRGDDRVHSFDSWETPGQAGAMDY